MSEQQKTITSFIGADAGFKYAMCFHYIPGTESHFAEFLRQRFELEYWWKIEMSDKGNWHIQACGRTMKEITDNHDRKRFQRAGYYGKYLKRKGEYVDEEHRSLKNPYSIALCSKPWRNNVLYVTKPFKLENGVYRLWADFTGNCSESDDIWRDTCIESEHYHFQCVENHVAAVARKKKVVSFEQTIVSWYESLSDPPVTETSIIERLYDDRVIPCGPYSARAYVRAAGFLMNRYVKDMNYRKLFIDRCLNLLDK